MKNLKAITLVMMVMALSATPTFAQRKGGTPIRTSSISTHSSVSSPIRTSSSSKRGSVSSPTRTSSNSKRSSASSLSNSKLNSANTNRSSVGVSSRSESVRNGGKIGTTSHSPSTHATISSPNFDSRAGSSLKRNSNGSKMLTVKVNTNHSREKMIQKRRSSQAGLTVSSKQTRGNKSTIHSTVSNQQGFSYFVYSPQMNCVMKMSPSLANTISSPRQINRSGLWGICSSNWYDNHTTNKSSAQDFAKQNYNMNMIDYGFSEGVLYVISEDSKGVFLQACDESGNVLDEQKISREYRTIVTTEENSGCWIMKKKDKDPLYYCFDGNHLLMYDADEGKTIIDINFCETVTYTIIKENHHTYFQVYNDTDGEHPLASSEIDDFYNTIDIEPSNSCRCFIKDPENNRSTEVFWLGDVIMFNE